MYNKKSSALSDQKAVNVLESDISDASYQSDLSLDDIALVLDDVINVPEGQQVIHRILRNLTFKTGNESKKQTIDRSFDILTQILNSRAAKTQQVIRWAQDFNTVIIEPNTPHIVLDKHFRIVKQTPSAKQIGEFKVGQSLKNFVSQPQFDSSGAPFKNTDFKMIKCGRKHVPVRINDLPLSVEKSNFYLLELGSQGLTRETALILENRFRTTSSELEILDLLIQRYSVAEISEIRNGSIRTVRKHLESLMNKLQVKSMLDAVLVVNDLSTLVSNTNENALPQYSKNQKTENWQTYSSKSLNGSFTYRVDGISTLRPLIIINSIELATRLPDAFYELAQDHGYCVYSVCRPGYLASQPLDSIARQSQILQNWMKDNKIENATVMAHCTGVPVAAHLAKHCKRVTFSIFANSTLGGNPITAFSNSALSKFINQAVSSRTALKFTRIAMYHWGKMVGPSAFYKSFLGSSEEDRNFIEENPDLISNAFHAMYQTDASTHLLDLQSTFGSSQSCTYFPCKNISAILVNGKSTRDDWKKLGSENSANFGIKQLIVSRGDVFCGFLSFEEILKAISKSKTKN